MVDNPHSTFMVEAFAMNTHCDATSDEKDPFAKTIVHIFRPCCEVGLHGKDACGSNCSYQPDKAETAQSSSFQNLHEVSDGTAVYAELTAKLSGSFHCTSCSRGGDTLPILVSIHDPEAHLEVQKCRSEALLALNPELP